MGAVEAIVTIGTSFVLISLFMMCRHIMKRNDRHFARRCAATAKYGCAPTRIKRLSKNGGKRKLFAVYRLGKIKKFGRFLT